MATKMTKSTIVKSTDKKTTAPKTSRARKTDTIELTDVRPITYDRIAMRAYERFCARGYEHGHDVEDWLAAESELRAVS